MRKFLFIFSAILLLAAFFFGYLMGGSYGARPQEDMSKIDIGVAEDYPVGTIKPWPAEKIIIFSDKDGIYAISTRCTHLGCTLKFNNNKATCPCHGAMFTMDGIVLKGPAKQNLPWFEIQQGQAGHLYVDKSKTVPAGTKCKFDNK